MVGFRHHGSACGRGFSSSNNDRTFAPPGILRAYALGRDASRGADVISWMHSVDLKTRRAHNETAGLRHDTWRRSGVAVLGARAAGDAGNRVLQPGVA